MRTATLILFSILFLSGCSSIKVDTSESNMIAPICLPGSKKINITILWGTLWRSDQKEPRLRESMAKQGIEQFINESDCVNAVSIHQIELEQRVPSNTEILKLVTEDNIDQVLFIVVRELGPTLVIGFPSIVEGHTEAILEVKVIDSHTNSVINDSKVHWRHGGKFVIKGTGSLTKDMSSALQSILTKSD